MRPEQLYLVDIVEAAAEISSYIVGHDHDSFLGDSLVRSAVIFQLIIIGEAANHLTDAFRETYPEVAWRKAIGLRNLAVHGYFSLDWEIIWEVVSRDIPVLRGDIVRIYEVEFPVEELPDDPGL